MIEQILSKFNQQPNSFGDFIRLRVPISEELKTKVMSVCSIETFSQNHLLIKEGMVAHRLYFIYQGSARTYYYHNGKDITSWIYREGQLITSWSSFYNRTPSFENVELTEDTTLHSITFEDLQLLYQQESKLQAFGRIMVEEQLVFLDAFYKGFMFMTAREKYDTLLSIFPDVTQRVNLGHIASFLGITQETLSRIRNKK